MLGHYTTAPGDWEETICSQRVANAVAYCQMTFSPQVSPTTVSAVGRTLSPPPF